MPNDKNNLKRNSEGYCDPTAYKAIMKADADSDSARFHKLLHAIFDICEVSGFTIEGRLILTDENTGKTWR